MSAHDLDGTYTVTSTSSYQGPLAKKSDGTTTITNGMTERYDDAKCKWTSTFEVINEGEVRMTSVADPSEADVDFLLTAPDGTPTREAITYQSNLKLARKGDKVQMSGQVQYGNDLVLITLRSV